MSVKHKLRQSSQISLKLNTTGSNDNFFRRNLLQASETGDFCNSIPNATQKNLRKRNMRKEYVETNLSASKSNFHNDYLKFEVTA